MLQNKILHLVCKITMVKQIPYLVISYFSNVLFIIFKFFIYLCLDHQQSEAEVKGRRIRNSQTETAAQGVRESDSRQRANHSREGPTHVGDVHTIGADEI